MNKQLGWLDRYLTVWIFAAMALGLMFLVGYFVTKAAGAPYDQSAAAAFTARKLQPKTSAG